VPVEGRDRNRGARPEAQRRDGFQGLPDAESYGFGRGRRRWRGGQDDSIDEHCYDTISGSDWLGDQDAIEFFCNEIPKELLRLEHWDAPGAASLTGELQCVRSAA